MLLCNYSGPRCMLICVFVCLGEEADFILGPGPKKQEENNKELGSEPKLIQNMRIKWQLMHIIFCLIHP